MYRGGESGEAKFQYNITIGFSYCPKSIALIGSLFLFQDGDGFVTFEEMRDWIKFTQKRYVSEDVERQWQSHLDSDPQVS